jgi:hypothetical protein
MRHKGFNVIFIMVFTMIISSCKTYYITIEKF